MIRLRALGMASLLSFSFGCIEAGLGYMAVKDAERNEANNRRPRQRLVQKDQRIRNEAPQCWDPVVEWRKETRKPQRRQNLWQALPEECKEQVRRQ